MTQARIKIKTNLSFDDPGENQTMNQSITNNPGKKKTKNQSIIRWPRQEANHEPTYHQMT